MRAEITLDAEAERLVRETMRRRGPTFDEVLNQVILSGLAALDAGHDETPFEVVSSPMRRLAEHDPAHLNRLANDLEAQAFVDLTARLQHGSKGQ